MAYELDENRYNILLNVTYKPQGGLQKLLLKLKNQLFVQEIEGTTKYFIEISDEDRERIGRYANEYGEGGPQDILKEVFPDLV